MPNSTSTEKRVRQNEKKRKKNKAVKSEIKTKKKHLLTLIEEENYATAEEELHELFSLCDRAAGKGIIHKNKAARIKSRISKRLRNARSEEE